MFAINRLLLPVKCHNVCFFGAMAGCVPFLMTYAHQLGASPSTVGVLYASLPFGVMVAKPLLGSLADKLQQLKTVFLCSLLMMNVGFFSIYFIPSSNDSIKTLDSPSILCRSDTFYLTRCFAKSLGDISGWTCTATCRSFDNCTFAEFEPYFRTAKCDDDRNDLPTTVGLALKHNSSYLLLNETCFLIPVQIETMNSSRDLSCGNNNETLFPCSVSCTNIGSSEGFNFDSPTDSLFGVHTQIVFLWICMSIAYTGMGVAVSMGDAITLDLLGDNKNAFGLQRLWGSIGWGSFSVVAGQLIDYASKGLTKLDFSPGFYLTLTLGTIDLIVSSNIKVIKKKRPKNVAKNIGLLMLKPKVFIFAIGVFAVGVLTGVMWTFLILYLNILGASQLLVGLAMAVQCFLGELPFFFVSGWLLKKLGHAHSLTLALFVFGVRMILYSLISNPWTVLPIELTNGITYGVFFSALATYSSIIAPPGTSATMQGILQGIYEGFGVGVGSLVGGFLFEIYGGSTMFFIFGCGSVCCSFILSVANMIISNCSTSDSGIVLVEISEKQNGIEDDSCIGSKMLDLSNVKDAEVT